MWSLWCTKDKGQEQSNELTIMWNSIRAPESSITSMKEMQVSHAANWHLVRTFIDFCILEAILETHVAIKSDAGGVGRTTTRGQHIVIGIDDIDGHMKLQMV